MTPAQPPKRAESTSEGSLIGFRRHVHCVVIAGEAVYLRTAREIVAVSGAVIEQLAPLLNGTLTATQIGRCLPHLPAAEVRSGIDELMAAGFVGTRRTHDDDVAARAYWDLTGSGGPEAGATVGVRAVGRHSTGAVEPVTSALVSAGMNVRSGTRPDAWLEVVLCDDYTSPELHEVNRAALDTDQRWLLASLGGPDLRIGPFFGPGSACWTCLASRMRLHQPGVGRLRSAGHSSAAPETALPTTRALGAHTIALQVVKWLAGVTSSEESALWITDTVTLQTRRHPVRRRPQCAECGDPQLVSRTLGRPFKVETRYKVDSTRTSHRAATTWAMYQDLADPVTGVTGEVRRDPRAPDWVHSWTAGPNLAIPQTDLSGLRAGIRQLSGGKGCTEIEAKTSALCEALERFSGTRAGDEPVVLASYSGLVAERDDGEVVHPDRCQLFDPRQYADRHSWNARHSNFQRVPERFDDDEVIEWTPAWSLTYDQRRFLPTGLAYFGVDHPALRANSNGNAAGATREDAALQGLFELIERDAVALWWYNRTCQPGVDLASFGDTWVNSFTAGLGELSRQVWVLDLTTDLGVPVMSAVSRRTDGAQEQIMFGFGAHLDPAVALRRALAELGQLLPTTLGEGPGDDAVEDWWATASLATHRWLGPAADSHSLTWFDGTHRQTADLGVDVATVVDTLAEKGLEVIVIEQTRPDIGLPVVKVVVPGLRHFWSRFASGRLFDVPVALGRLASPTPYCDLNPVPLFL